MRSSEVKYVMLVLFTVLNLLSNLPSQGAQARSVAAPAVEWRDPLGFTVRIPQTWRVDTNTKDLILLDSREGAWVLVHPFLLQRSVPAGQWLPLSLAQFGKLMPRARIVRTAQRSRMPDEVLASVQFEDQGVPWQATLLCSIAGKGGMLYAVAASAGQFPSRRQQLVEVLRTFRFTQPSVQQGGGSQLQFVRWQDPREGAFSIEVPQGWRVEGGMFRFNAVDVRAATQMSSPDGQVRIIAGDSAIPTHTIPNQTLAMTGFREGSWYSPGFNTKMLVRSFVPGDRFAVEYVRSKLAQGCSGLQLLKAQPLPQASAELTRLFTNIPGLVSMQVYAGEAAFSCSINGQPMNGYLFAGTLLVPPVGGGGGGLWQVPFLHGFIATQAQTGAGQAALHRLVHSIQINPQWAQRQRGATAATSAAVSDVHRHVTGIIEQGYWERERVRYESSRKFSNNILGQTDVVDPVTGERWKVASGHNYYWRQDYTDNVTGTNTYERPDTNFSPLLEY